MNSPKKNNACFNYSDILKWCFLKKHKYEIWTYMYKWN